MTAPLIPAVWFPFILNLLLQVFDGLLSYHVLSEGVPEANPLVSRAISEWGVVWGLFYSKTFACVLLLLIFAGLLALILGLLVWADRALNLIQMHMLLGLLAVGALWVIGIGQAFSRGGSWLLAACALVVGAAMIIIGLNQSALMLGPFHWVVQILHLVLGLLVIGM